MQVVRNGFPTVIIKLGQFVSCCSIIWFIFILSNNLNKLNVYKVFYSRKRKMNIIQ